MDCQVAPLRIVKKTNPSSERLKELHPQEKSFPLPIPRRSSSITSDSWFIPASMSTPTEPFCDISVTPPLDARQFSLNVPKVRCSTDRSHSRPRKKESVQRESMQHAIQSLPSVDRASKFTGGHLATRSHDDNNNQMIKNKQDECTTHNLLRVLHTPDKEITSFPSHGPSKHTMTHSQSNNSVKRGILSLVSGFKMQYCPSPVTSLKMDLQPERFVNHPHDTEFHVRITVLANIDHTAEPINRFTDFIDTAVLLNIKSKSEFDKVVCMAQTVTDALQPGDSLSIACVNSEKEDRVDVLMPLCQGPNVDIKRLASGHSSLGRPVWKGANDVNTISEAINNLAAMLTCAKRVRHIFLVSIDCNGPLNLTGCPLIGLSTVTMSDRHDLQFCARLSWHIQGKMAANVLDVLSLQRQVDRSIRAIRSGFAPGFVGDMQIQLLPGIGCTILSRDITTMEFLRPGESWSLFVKMKASKASRFDRLEENIRSLLRCDGMNEGQDGSVLVARLSFKHSLLPSCSSVLSKSCHILEKDPSRGVAM